MNNNNDNVPEGENPNLDIGNMNLDEEIRELEENELENDGEQPNFSLTPARAVEVVINFTTNQGRKIYTSATEKLSEELFDCESSELFQFKQTLKDRAAEFGWSDKGLGIMSIPEDVNNDEKGFVCLATNHGEIDMATIRAFEYT